MYIFVNSQGRVLVTQTDLFVHSSFALPELDQQANAIVVATSVMPKPIIQIQGTLGRQNYLNVFGENPMQIQIDGVVVGRDCQTFQTASSALGVSVDFFAQHGVVNRLQPLRYTITGQPARQAFLVGMTVQQDSAFVDMARFSMSLLAESLQDQATPGGATRSTTTAGSRTTVRNTGLVRSLSTGSTPAAGDVPVGTALFASGDPATPYSAELSLTGFDSSEDAFRA